ncbi:MAG TPA: hypothetical protein VGD05_06715 [Pyrinomonadaceae bacterium]
MSKNLPNRRIKRRRFVDERSGREAALKRNLPVVGTLGLLERAAEKGLLDFSETLQTLKANGFFIALHWRKIFMSATRKGSSQKPNSENAGSKIAACEIKVTDTMAN